MGRRFLVTGGLGFLGAPLVRALLTAGHSVRVLDNSSRGSSARLSDLKADVEIVNGDIRDGAAVERAVQGTDCVCHLAYVNGTEFFYQRPAHVLDVGIKGIVNVVDACLKFDVGELVLASSSEVYQTPPSVPTDESVPLSVPNPHNPRYSYGAGKIISELMALHYGREHFERVLIVRPHNVFGPDMGWEHVIPQFVRRLVALRPQGDQEVPFPIQGTGDQSRSFIFIDDFTDGLMAVIARGEHLNIYNIGTAEEVAIRDLAYAVADCLGMRICVVPGPEAVGGTLRRCPDVRKLGALGFSPRYTLRQALPGVIAWYAEHAAPAAAETA